MTHALEHTSHRPWPLPSSPWVMHQRWTELLFAHWPVDASELTSQLPRGLELDLFDGEAWVGLVPFRMSNVRLRYTPPFPGFSTFPELNLRTYVRSGDRAGVWFLTLEAAQKIAVRIARAWFNLPYHDAKMRCEQVGKDIEYESRRTHKGAGTPRFKARYGPRGPVYQSRTGTLEHWLTERYCLYACRPNGALLSADVQHGPWPLQSAEAEIEVQEITAAHGISVAVREPLLHFAQRIDVVTWAPRACPNVRTSS